jgi:hypothetical protein
MIVSVNKDRVSSSAVSLEDFKAVCRVGCRRHVVGVRGKLVPLC